jgi:glycolate oxidase
MMGTVDQLPTVTDSDLLRALRKVLPLSAILTEVQARRPYESDGLNSYRAMPRIVVLPANETEVQGVLKACHQLGVPVVPRGQGTGLSGGALPHKEGVLMSLARLNRILEVNSHARTARVQPGVRNLAISEAVASLGLYYAPDPSSQIACSIGGNVAENSGGVHCLKYGLTVHNLLRVRAYLMDGTVFEAGSEGPDAAGFDLMALLTGSEGLLAVVTEITVRLLPKPRKAQALLASFDEVEKAGQAVADIIAAGIIPAGLEMMDGPATRAAEAFVHANYPADAEALLICESDGTEEEVADEIERMRSVLETAGATEIRYSSDEAERLKFWAGRKAAFPAVGRLAPDYYCIDGTIPRRTLGAVLNWMYARSKEIGIEVVNVFHAGDGNLHPLLLFDASIPGDFERTEVFANEILAKCVEVGGTITGEHGVGVEKIDAMCVQFSSDELETFHGVKRAFDPSGLLNPGKAVPALHRCAELGRMHVHHGALPHPELPRF